MKQEPCALRRGDAWRELRGEGGRGFEPGAEVVRQLLVDFAAQALGDGGAFAGGGDGDLQVAAADHGAEEEIAVGDIVDAVAEDVRARCAPR